MKILQNDLELSKITPPIEEIISSDLPSKNWIPPIRLDDNVLKPTIKDLYLEKSITVVSKLQNELSNSYNKIDKLEKKIKSIRKIYN